MAILLAAYQLFYSLFSLQFLIIYCTFFVAWGWILWQFREYAFGRPRADKTLWGSFLLLRELLCMLHILLHSHTILGPFRWNIRSVGYNKSQYAIKCVRNFLYTEKVLVLLHSLKNSVRYILMCSNLFKIYRSPLALKHRYVRYSLSFFYHWGTFHNGKRHTPAAAKLFMVKDGVGSNIKSYISFLLHSRMADGIPTKMYLQVKLL